VKLINALVLQNYLTPEPWDISGGSADVLEIVGPDWAEVCDINLDDHGAKPTDEQLANARLIEVAPKLLRLVIASHLALQSYAYGNSAPDLAKGILEQVTETLEELDAPYRN